jgi:hypothetical protein
MAACTLPDDEIAVISRIDDLVPFADAIRSHVHEVVTSPIFKGSRRSRQFLEYVVERSLKGESDRLKERMIGIHLFGRDPCYDKTEDAIVRVTAAEVRRRLLQFYAEPGRQAGFRIDLAAGSYLVKFWRPEPRAASKETVIQDELTSVTHPPVQRMRRFNSWRGMALLCAATALVAIAINLYWPRNGLEQRQPDRIEGLPWSEMLQDNRQLKIVLSDPSMAEMQRIFDFRISLADYAGHHYLPEQVHLPPGSQQFLKVFRGDNVAAVDAAIALKVGRLVHSLRAETLRARLLQSRDFKIDDNFIILGSPASDPWVGLFQDKLDFVFKYDLDRKEEVIWNKRPFKAEESIYVPTTPGWGTGQAFAVIGFFANPNQSGHILLLAGSNAVATEAAGQMASDAELMSRILKDAGLDPRQPQLQFEILLRVETIASSLDRFNVIACHRLGVSVPR